MYDNGYNQGQGQGTRQLVGARLTRVVKAAVGCGPALCVSINYHYLFILRSPRGLLFLLYMFVLQRTWFAWSTGRLIRHNEVGICVL